MCGIPLNTNEYRICNIVIILMFKIVFFCNLITNYNDTLYNTVYYKIYNINVMVIYRLYIYI